MIIDQGLQGSGDLTAVREAGGGDRSRTEQLKRACQDFESIFVAYMLRTMRKTVPSSGLFGGGLGEAYFQDLFDEEVAKAISETGRLGTWKVLFQQLSGQAPEVQAALGSRAHGFSLIPRWAGIRGYRENVEQPLSAEQAPSVIGRVQRFRPIVQMAARRHRVDPLLIQAVIAQESGGDPRAVSPKGAKGLMQLMDETAREMGVQDSMDPTGNILGGTRYLRALLDRFDGDVSLTLAAYNAGAGVVDRYGGIPPYPETRRYVEQVLNYRRLFSH